MSGGMGGALGQRLVDTGIRFGGKAPTADRPAVAYTPATPNVYVSPFSSVQSNQPPVSAIAPAPAQQIQQAGLQALMANMMAQYPNMRGQLAMPPQGFMPQRAVSMPTPSFSAPALNYRPNMQAIQENLNRVKPSVYKTDLDNARARIAELEAAEEARQNQPALQSYYDSGGGG